MGIIVPFKDLSDAEKQRIRHLKDKNDKLRKLIKEHENKAPTRIVIGKDTVVRSKVRNQFAINKNFLY